MGVNIYLKGEQRFPFFFYVISEMKIFDLSHQLTGDMPVFPGKGQPSFLNIAQLETDRYREKHLSLDSHVGTHIDSPAHMLASGLTLDQFPVSKFTGPAFVIDIEAGTKIITIDVIRKFMTEIGKAEFVLFNTGWYKLWGIPGFTEGFPVLETRAAEWLTGFRLKGIGVDTISVDPTESKEWPVHFKLFSAGFILAENLFFHDKMPHEGEFSCFPLKIDKADGSPVRAVFRTV